MKEVVTKIVEMHKGGMTISAIARESELARATVRNYISIYNSVDASKGISPRYALLKGLLENSKKNDPDIWTSNSTENYVESNNIILEISAITFLNEIGIVKSETPATYVANKLHELQIKLDEDISANVRKAKRYTNIAKDTKFDEYDDPRKSNAKIEQNKKMEKNCLDRIELLNKEANKLRRLTTGRLERKCPIVLATAIKCDAKLWYLSCSSLSYEGNQPNEILNLFVVRLVDSRGENCHFSLFTAGISSSKIINFIKKFVILNASTANNGIVLVLLDDNEKCWGGLEKKYCKGRVKVVTPFVNKIAREDRLKRLQALSPSRKILASTENAKEIVNEIVSEIADWETLTVSERDNAVKELARKYSMSVNRLNRLISSVKNNDFKEIKLGRKSKNSK